MARFGGRQQSQNKSGVHSFNPKFQSRSAQRKRKKMGVIRTVFSGLSLLAGSGMFYVSLHYIPAFIQPKQVLKFATGDSVGMKTYDFDRKSKLYELIGPYVDLFHIDRTYVKTGQRVSVKYDLPKGARAKLDIVQCEQAWVVEIFKCKVVGQFSSTTKRQSGVESFSIKHGGFYHFRETAFGIPAGEPYRIIWERSL